MAGRLHRLQCQSRERMHGPLQFVGLAIAMTCLASTAMASAAGRDDTEAALMRPVTLCAPYPQSYLGAPTDEIELEYAVFEMAKQAVLGYDFVTSRRNVGKICSVRIRPDIRRMPLRGALEAILAPLGVGYTVSGGEIVLVPRPGQAATDPLDRPVTLAPPYGDSKPPPSGMPISMAVMLLAEQAGLKYDWNTSRERTSPACQRWVQPKFDGVPLRIALERLLDPAKLTYRLEGDVISLAVKPGEKLDDPLEVRVTLLPPYPMDYEGARTDMMLLQQVVLNLARQAGLRYDWAASRQALGTSGERYVRPDVRDEPLGQALTRLLGPLKLSFEVRGDVIALTQMEKPETPPDGNPGRVSDAEVARRLQTRVTLTRPYPEIFPGAPTHKITLYNAVNALTRQAGVTVDWQASQRDLGPVGWRYVYPKIENEQCGSALTKLLAPFRLGWRIGNGQVIIERR